MATQSETYVQKLKNYCSANQIAQPQFQDYSDTRGIRTAWSSGVIVQGREYRSTLWRDYRFIDQSYEDSAQVALKALTGASNSAQQYNAGGGYTQTQ